MPQRISFYIDGYNLYNGIIEKYGKKWLWLDLGKMCDQLKKPDQEIVSIHYCTAMVKSSEDSKQRQLAYLAALKSVSKLRLHLGSYQDIPKYCKNPKCGALIGRFKEKQTDTRIATLIVADAMADRSDVLAVVGGDEDHVPPVQTVYQECEGKKAIVCLPPARKCGKLVKATRSKPIDISENLLRNSQFPDTVNAKGKSTTRPSTWC